MITAIVLVHVAADRIPEAAQAIADLDGVDEVYSCAGDVDLIAIVKVTRHEELADVIAGRLSKVDGVRRTDTHIAFRSWSRADTEATFDCSANGPPPGPCHRDRSVHIVRRVHGCDGVHGQKPRQPAGRSQSLHPAGQHPLPGAGVDRFCHPVQGGRECPVHVRGRSGRHPVEGHQRSGGVDQHRVAHRTALAGEHPPEHRGVDGGVPAAQVLRRRRGQPECRRVDDLAADLPAADHPHRCSSWWWSARRARRPHGTPARTRRGPRGPRPSRAPAARRRTRPARRAAGPGWSAARGR